MLAMSAGLAGAQSKPPLNIGYVDGWSDSVATTHVAAEVIKQKLGYDVKLMPVATGIMWQGVATGKRDQRDFTLWKGEKPGEPSWPSP